ncbi:sugar phosphate isomerase/epimerase family protein [Halalkalibaculum sp. DA3122]|uniref:sugar phosphate isomerase/epimerase family protein n=1 Tax=Halalkalibaculum sp. DA3122 TaxID=3373607 RepID=UPI00375434AE
MTKVGFNLLAWSAVISEELLPTVERLKEIGYDGIEIFLGIEDEAMYKKFGKEVEDLGLELNCVMVLGPDENPIDPSAEVRKKGLERIKWAVDRAHDMNADVICGPMHSAFANFADKAPDEDEYKRSAEILAKAGEYAAQADILLTPEAINRFECYLCNTMDQLVGLVERVSHPNVKAHFDTHHANIEEKTLSGALKKVAPVLGHVHISENDRGTPGSGHVPWDETFSTLAEIGYDGWLTIEAFTRDDPDFANSINVWREYNKPWDVAEQGYAFIKEMSEKVGL